MGILPEQYNKKALIAAVCVVVGMLIALGFSIVFFTGGNDKSNGAFKKVDNPSYITVATVSLYKGAPKVDYTWSPTSPFVGDRTLYTCQSNTGITCRWDRNLDQIADATLTKTVPYEWTYTTSGTKTLCVQAIDTHNRVSPWVCHNTVVRPLPTTTTIGTTTTAPTTTVGTTTVADVGTIIHRLNYEYASADGIDPNQGGKQCQNISEPGRGTLTKDTSTFNSGAASANILNPITPSNATYGRSACEVLTGHTAKTGQDIYYTMAMKFPMNWSGYDTWSQRTSHAVFAYDNVPASGPIVVECFTNRCNISLAAGNCVLAVGCDYDNGFGEPGNIGHSNNVSCTPSCHIIPPDQLTLGAWHQLIIHVRETPRPDGLVEGWWRRKGESTWNKTVTMSGMPTVALGTNSFGVTFSAATYDAGTNQITDKFGIQNVNYTQSTSFNQDDDCITTSFAAAVSCLGG